MKKNSLIVPTITTAKKYKATTTISLIKLITIIVQCNKRATKKKIKKNTITFTRSTHTQWLLYYFSMNNRIKVVTSSDLTNTTNVMRIEFTASLFLLFHLNTKLFTLKKENHLWYAQKCMKNLLFSLPSNNRTERMWWGRSGTEKKNCN